jgi:hypothetical protein
VRILHEHLTRENQKARLPFAERRLAAGKSNRVDFAGQQICFSPGVEELKRHIQEHEIMLVRKAMDTARGKQVF